MGCPIDYYTGHFWRVLSFPPPVGEKAFRIIHINNPVGNVVQVVTMAAHPGDEPISSTYEGVYNPERGVIEEPGVEKPTWMIGCQPGAPLDNFIVRLPLGTTAAERTEGATWTAQDTGTRG